MWSSQGIKSAQIAIFRVYPTGLTRTRVTSQRAVRMECLRALLVCLIDADTAATKKVRFCYQTAMWEPAEVTSTVYVFYGFSYFRL